MSEKSKVNFIEAYKCPICKRRLPVHDVEGKVIVYCRHCKSEVRVSIERVKVNK